MPWTDEQWTDFADLLAEGWGGQFSIDKRAAYRILLAEIAPDEATAALKRLLYRGQKFRPTPAELIAAAHDDPSRPSFEEAYRAIFGHGGILEARPAPGAYADLAEKRRAEAQAAKERGAEFHPLIASFVTRYGIDRLRTMEIHDPEYGEVRRRELHDAWDRHVKAFEGREVAALAAGDREGLRQLDPLRVLGLEAPQRAQLPEGPSVSGAAA